MAQVATGAVVITTVEFVAVIVNIYYRAYGITRASAQPFLIVCLLFTLWFLLYPAMSSRSLEALF